METQATSQFPLPSEIEPAPGTEDAAGMYPYFTRFGPEDDKRFWFYNGMHFSEPIPAFDTITAEAPYISLGAYNTRVFAVPAVLGIDHRIVNGRVEAIPIREIITGPAFEESEAPFDLSGIGDLHAADVQSTPSGTARSKRCSTRSRQSKCRCCPNSRTNASLSKAKASPKISI